MIVIHFPSSKISLKIRMQLLCKSFQSKTEYGQYCGGHPPSIWTYRRPKYTLIHFTCVVWGWVNCSISNGNPPKYLQKPVSNSRILGSWDHMTRPPRTSTVSTTFSPPAFPSSSPSPQASHPNPSLPHPPCKRFQFYPLQSFQPDWIKW